MPTPVRLLLPLLLLCTFVATACAVREEVAPRDEGDAGEPGEAPSRTDANAQRQMEREIFELVNAERRERGLPEYAWDNQLARLARRWNHQMQDAGKLQHQDGQRMLERSDGFVAVGENIFRATGSVHASTIHVAWMHSDGHRANVLRNAFNRIGVGVLCAENGDVWATERFGQTSGSDLPPPSDDIPPEQPIVAERGNGPTCPGAEGPEQIELRAHGETSP